MRASDVLVEALVARGSLVSENYLKFRMSSPVKIVNRVLSAGALTHNQAMARLGASI